MIRWREPSADVQQVGREIVLEMTGRLVDRTFILRVALNL